MEITYHTCIFIISVERTLVERASKCEFYVKKFFFYIVKHYR
jgi:hypothetical protein